MWLPFLGLVSLLWIGSGVDLARTTSRPPERPTHLGNSVAGHVPEPPPTVLRVGDSAPDFSFEAYDGHVMRLHHLLDQGAVLLVFGAREADLARLQRERGALLDLGVVPVAIVDSRPGSTGAMARRMGLHYSVLADSRGVIADLFSAIDGERVVPSWFVLDGHGHVRGGIRGGLPTIDWTRVCARALALPMPGVAFPTFHGARAADGRP